MCSPRRCFGITGLRPHLGKRAQVAGEQRDGHLSRTLADQTRELGQLEYFGLLPRRAWRSAAHLLHTRPNRERPQLILLAPSTGRHQAAALRQDVRISGAHVVQQPLCDVVHADEVCAVLELHTGGAGLGQPQCAATDRPQLGTNAAGLRSSLVQLIW